MEFASGNIFVRAMNMVKAGDVIEGHAHNFDHVSIVLRGSVHVSATLADGTKIEREFFAPTSSSTIDRAHVLIKAGVNHKIVALEDNTVFWCVYAHRTPQDEVVQEYTGWAPAYS